MTNKKNIIYLILFICCIFASCSEKLGTEEFKKGVVLLHQGKYETSSSEIGAIDYFNEAYKLDSSWGGEIADELILFGIELVNKGEIINFIALDAKEVFVNALKFDNNKRKPLIFKIKDCYILSRDGLTLTLIKSIYGKPDQTIISEYINENQEERKQYLKNHELRKAFSLYDITFALCDDLPNIKQNLYCEIINESLVY